MPLTYAGVLLPATTGVAFLIATLCSPFVAGGAAGAAVLAVGRSDTGWSGAIVVTINVIGPLGSASCIAGFVSAAQIIGPG